MTSTHKRLGDRPLRRALALVAVGGLLLAACGDDDDAADTNAAAPADTAAPTGDTAAAGTTPETTSAPTEDSTADDGNEVTAPAAGEFTGPPVTVYWLNALDTPVASHTDSVAAVRAAVDAINAQGGLNGSEVMVEICNDIDANAELSCVRDAADNDAIAFIGSSITFNPEGAQAILAEAGIPNIAPSIVQPVEFGNPINFPITMVGPAVLACPALMADAIGAKRISVVAVELPTGLAMMQSVEKIAATNGLEYGASVAIPITQTDYSGPVSQLAESDPDAVISVLAPTGQAGFFSAMRSLGQQFDGFCSLSPAFPLETLKGLGEDAANVYIATGMPPTSAAAAETYPLVKQFRDEMTAAFEAGDEDASLDNLRTAGYALNAWLGVQVLKMAAENIDGTVTAENLLAALNGLQVDLSGAGLPPIDFSTPVPVPGLERLFNPEIRLVKWDPAQGEVVETEAEPVSVVDVMVGLAG